MKQLKATEEQLRAQIADLEEQKVKLADPVFVAAQAREPNGGLIVIPDGFLNVHRAEVILQAARYNLPAVYPWRFFAEQGGLLSYGSEQRDIFRLAASYVDRILKGEMSSELPVQAPVKYELVINLKTAKALVLFVPPALLTSADTVIDE